MSRTLLVLAFGLLACGDSSTPAELPAQPSLPDSFDVRTVLDLRTSPGTVAQHLPIAWLEQTHCRLVSTEYDQRWPRFIVISRCGRR